MKSLFGEEIDAVPRRQRKDLAHAAPPGTGPEGERCGTCLYDHRLRYHDAYYHKCELMRRLWTNGPGTDIKMKDPACRRWGPKSPSSPATSH